MIGKILTVRFENAENLEKADHAFIIFFREPITVLQNHIIEMMKEDERRHGDAARNLGGAGLPKPIQKGMQAVSKIMTTGAYWV